MREARKQGLAQAELLAMQALERARVALHQAPCGPERRPDPTSQFRILHRGGAKAVPQAAQAWLAQQPEIATIALTLCVCMIGILRG
jgi:hypothetical protein